MMVGGGGGGGANHKADKNSLPLICEIEKYRRSPRDQLIREKKNIKHDRKDNKLVKFGYFEKRLSLHRYSYLGTVTW